MKFHFSILFFLCLALTTNSQSFERTYGNIDDDIGNAVDVCQNGSYIITGSVQDLYTGDQDIFVALINIFGDTIWARTISNPYQNDFGTDVIQCLDLGILVTGCTSDDNIMSPFIAKFTLNGQLEWFKKYDTDIQDGYAHTIEQNPDSTIVICGTNFAENYPYHYFLLQVNRNGNYQWFKEYNGLSGMSRYIVNDMCLSSDGNFILGGKHMDLSVSNYYCSWLKQVNKNLSGGWGETYIENEHTTYMLDVDLTSDNGYVLVGSIFEGYIYFPDMDYDIFIIKTDASGNEEWRKKIGFLEEAEHGHCIAQTNDGGYIIGSQRNHGTSWDDIWLVKIDEDGDTLWSREFGGSYNDLISDIKVTPDGGYVLCGTTNSYGMGGDDIYLIKTDENGIVTGNIEPGMNNIEMIVYPNPFIDAIHIEYPQDDYSYTVYDINGRVLLAGKKQYGKNEGIDVSGLSPGVYLFQAQSEKHSYSIKIIKQ